jgi:hypothetical protein
MNLKITFIEQLTPKQKQSLTMTAVVTLVVVIGLYVGVIQVQKSTKNSNLKKIEEITKSLDDAKRQEKQSPALEDEVKKTTTKLNNIVAEFVPESEPNPWATRVLGAFMNSRNLENVSLASVIIQPSSLFPDFPYQEALIKTSFKTYYHTLGRFLANFENSYPYFRVQNLDISPIVGAVNREDLEKLSVKIDIIALISTNKTKP